MGNASAAAAMLLLLGSCQRRSDTDDDDTDVRDTSSDSDVAADTDTGQKDSDTGTVVDADADGFSTADDCDDADASVHPGAEEACNGRDDDCDGASDEDLPTERYRPDLDGDGYGDAAAADVIACEQPPDTSLSRDDCDDTRAEVHPGAEEMVCDGLDNDCEGSGLGYQALLGSTEYEWLEDAVDEAVDGDVVYVCVGTHDVSLRIATDDVSLTLAGYTGDAADVVLDGGGTHRILAVRGPDRITLRDLTFANGYIDDGDDIYGGAIRMDTGALVVESSAFVDNVAPRVAGMGGAIMALHADLEVRDSEFTENVAGYDGGAIEFYVSPHLGDGTTDPNEPYELAIEDSWFADNEAGNDGSAVAVDGDGSFEARFISVAFDRNVAASSGGAVKVMVYDPTNINFADCSFSENTAVIGGAMELASNTTTDLTYSMEVSDTTFTDNYASAGGGAVNLTDGQAQSTTFRGCVFDGNVAAFGGAVCTSGGSPLSASFVDTRFTNNVGTSYGGALFIGNTAASTRERLADIALEGCHVEGNTASTYGGALMASSIGDTTTITITDTRIVGNTAGTAGGGFWFQGNTTLTSTQSDWSDGATSTDNAPDDVYTLEGAFTFSTEDFVCADGLECL